MIIRELVENFNLKVFCGEEWLNQEVSGYYVSDMLSDVLGHAKSGMLWITLLNHLNVVAVASQKQLAAVLLVNNLQPDQQTMVYAQQEHIPILGTLQPTFEISGQLYSDLH